MDSRGFKLEPGTIQQRYGFSAVFKLEPGTSRIWNRFFQINLFHTFIKFSIPHSSIKTRYGNLAEFQPNVENKLSAGEKLMKTYSMSENPNHTSKMDTYKAVAGQTDVISFAWIKDNQPQYLHSQIYYKPGIGYFQATRDIQDYLGEKPIDRFVTLLVKFLTDKNGKVKINKDKTVTHFEVLPFTFSNGKLKQLQRLHTGDYPLQDHSISVTCEHNEYQKCEYQPKKENFINHLSKEDKKLLQDKVAELTPTLENYLGRSITLDYLKSKLEPQENVQEIKMIDDEDSDSLDLSAVLDLG